MSGAISLTEQQAVAFLKSKGYDVFEKVPSWEGLTDEGLLCWSVKLNAWATDISHAQKTHYRSLLCEIEKRRSA